MLDDRGSDVAGVELGGTVLRQQLERVRKA
jgi:hypothetical protein